jgi:hypothetical protein
MSIFDLEDFQSDRLYRTIEQIKEFEQTFAIELLQYGDVSCFVTEEKTDVLVKKVAEAWNLKHLRWLTPFSEGLKSKIDKFIFQKEHKERDYLSLDCRGLGKGDACRWLKAISEGIENGTLNKPILVIENVDQIPDGDRNIYDDPLYVEDILVRSWENELIKISDFYIDRRELTVILTCSPENQTLLGNACRICSYAWLGEFEEWYNRIKNI